MYLSEVLLLKEETFRLKESKSNCYKPACGHFVVPDLLPWALPTFCSVKSPSYIDQVNLAALGRSLKR